MTLRLLPSTLVNQIAAGEVVERPAAALKELVENAIDAQARTINITIEQAGKKMILVEDDGIGMLPQELELCLERHATSKLDDDDLFNIQTLGFRGEALPSIASVSRLQMWSRHAGSEHGHCITVEAGVKSALTPMACNLGTGVRVSDLFFATPARLKFIKSNTTEFNLIREQIERLAMAYPQVSFRLQHENRNVLDLPAVDDLRQRLHTIIGKEFIDNCSEYSYEMDGIKVRGYCGAPTFNRATSDQQFLFVNRRPVKDRNLLAVIRRAYNDFLSRDRFPVVVGFIELPPTQVDVNVHPTKAEVRFQNSQAVHSALAGGLRQALGRIGGHAATTIAHQALGIMHNSLSSHGTQTAPLAVANANPSPFATTEETSNRRHAYADYDYDYARATISGAPAGPTLQQILQDVKPITTSPSAAAPALAQPAVSHPEPVAQTMELQDPRSLPLGNAVAQIHQTYIIAESEEAMVIVDQHAAHERLIYEQLKTQAHKIHSQGLLIPEVVTVSPYHYEKLIEVAPELKALGLNLEGFGINTIIVRAIPALLSKCNIAQLVQDLGEELRQHDSHATLEHRLNQVCSTIACHGSIRAGRVMTHEEMNQLLRQIEASNSSAQCNHGRPTYIKLHKHDIEKLFKRRN